MDFSSEHHLGVYPFFIIKFDSEVKYLKCVNLRKIRVLASEEAIMTLLWVRKYALHSLEDENKLVDY